MNQNIVITMAGRGSRFYQAGYTVPKYEIMAHGHSLFYWSMLSLKNLLTPESNLIFVCLSENQSANYVREQCKNLGLNNVNIFELDSITDGQATSAYLSRHLWQPNSPLLVYNIDTYVNPHALQLSNIRQNADGWIPCFQVLGDHWSFVKLDENGWATDVAEKQRISDFASIGLYWFAKADEFVTAYDEFFKDSANLVKGERYIAPLYKNMISNHKKVSITDLPAKDIHVLGTPDELSTFLRKDLSEIL